VNRAAEDCAYEYPQNTRQVSELSSKDRPDKRACARYRREVVPEQNIPVCRVIILPVPKRMGWRGTICVEHKDFGDDELGVESVRYREKK
jgi:hypothetical protein